MIAVSIIIIITVIIIRIIHIIIIFPNIRLSLARPSVPWKVISPQMKHFRRGSKSISMMICSALPTEVHWVNRLTKKISPRNATKFESIIGLCLTAMFPAGRRFQSEQTANPVDFVNEVPSHLNAIRLQSVLKIITTR